jgi:hypothetical protein
MTTETKEVKSLTKVEYSGNSGRLPTCGCAFLVTLIALIFCVFYVFWFIVSAIFK